MPRQTRDPSEAKEQGESLADSIRRALEAAAVATDAAEEVSQISEQSRKAIEAAIAGQRKLTAIAGGAFAAAILSVGLAGLIYFRSTADLRIAADIQAAANKAGIEQIKVLTETVGEAAKALAVVTAMKEDIGAEFEGLSQSFTEALTRVSEESATLQPQVATAIQEHVDTALARTRDELLAALAQIEARTLEGGSDPELKAILMEVQARLAQKPAPAPVAAPAPAPKASTTRKTSTKKAKPRPAAPATNFSYP